MAAESLKMYLEIAAFGFAALFFFSRLVYGEFNAGMEVRLELKRVAHNDQQDLVVGNISMKRAEVGRLEIVDIVLEVAHNVLEPARREALRVDPNILLERHYSVSHDARVGGLVCGKAELTLAQEPNVPQFALCHRPNRIHLPPNDGTHVSQAFLVPRGNPVLVDATVLATRTGIWFGKPQWRVSAVSLPQDRLGLTQRE